MKIAADIFQDLGFMISAKKSVIQHVYRLEYLGFIWDYSEMKVYIQGEKTDGLIKMVKGLLGKHVVSIRMLAQVEGSLAATRYANKHSQVLTKMMEIRKI